MLKKVDLDELKKREKNGTLIGVFRVSNEDYHSGPGISRSALVQILKCPAYYKYCQSNPPEPTPFMQFGSAVHCRLLEPAHFEGLYVQAPEGRRGTNAYKEFEEKNQGKIILTKEEWDKIQNIAKKAEESPVVKKLLSGYVETAFYWKDPITGLTCKCKPDALNEIGVVDLKTTNYVSAEEFAKEAGNLLYHMQAAFYLDGVKLAIEQLRTETKEVPVTIPSPEMFTFLAVGKEEPHLFGGYLLGKESIEVGRELYTDALRTLKRCLESNHYPEYLDPMRDEIIQEIEIPVWARRKKTA